MMWVMVSVLCASVGEVSTDTSVRHFDAVLSSNHARFAALHSIVFRAVQRLEWSESGKQFLAERFPETSEEEIQDVTHDISFWEQDGYFRCEDMFADFVGENRGYIGLYNGDRYQVFEPAPRTLGLSTRLRNDNPSVAYNPFLIPFYAFAFAYGEEQSIAALRLYENWESIRGRCCTWEGLSDDGEYCVATFDVSAPYREQVSRVFFSLEHDYMPVKGEMLDNRENVLSEWEITEVQRVEVGGRSVIVPLESVLRFYGDSGKLLYLLTSGIEPTSLVLNEPIDESLFTIPAADANMIVDEDVAGVLPNIGNRIAETIRDVEGEVEGIAPIGDKHIAIDETSPEPGVASDASAWLGWRIANSWVLFVLVVCIAVGVAGCFFLVRLMRYSPREKASDNGGLGSQ